MRREEFIAKMEESVVPHGLRKTPHKELEELNNRLEELGAAKVAPVKKRRPQIKRSPEDKAELA